MLSLNMKKDLGLIYKKIFHTNFKAETQHKGACRLHVKIHSSLIFKMPKFIKMFSENSINQVLN